MLHTLCFHALLVGLLAAAGCGNDPSDKGSDPVPPDVLIRLPDLRPGVPFPEEVTAPAIPLGPAYLLDDRLRLNEIQMKGSHKSNHLRPLNNSDLQLQYDLPTLTDQFTKFGVRAVEIDFHYVDGEFWAYHLAGTDDRASCMRLRQCLQEIRSWSEANPGHHPIFIFLEPRDEEDAQKVVNHLEELEALVIASWPREKVLTPDDVSGKYADVQSAIRDRGWPTLRQTRGKAIFVMYAFNQTPYEYAHQGNDLWGRRMFVTFADMGWRHAGILAMDSAVEQEQQIKKAVANGFIVRTRSDDLPDRGRDFWTKRAAALRSGAQVVLTDYPDPNYIPGYNMSVPGGTPSRCNPIAIPAVCESLQVEDPALLAAPIWR